MRFIERLEPTPEERRTWEESWVLAQSERCLKLLESSEDPLAFQAFLLRFRRDWAVPRVAAALGIEVAEVYKATFRLKRRFEELLRDSQQRF